MILNQLVQMVPNHCLVSISLSYNFQSFSYSPYVAPNPEISCRDSGSWDNYEYGFIKATSEAQILKILLSWHKSVCTFYFPRQLRNRFEGNKKMFNK